jgi:LacI family transcriptional regulator
VPAYLSHVMINFLYLDSVPKMGKTELELTGVKEIARRANVSIGTVDRVIHNRVGVSEKTKDKINAIIRELDYQPNIFARHLASKKILRFAVLIPGSSEETNYWDGPLEGVQQAETEIKPYGIAIDLFLYDLNDKSSFVQQAGQLLSQEFDGVLLAPVFTEESLDVVAALKKDEIPYVFINSDLPEFAGLSYFGPDLFQSGYLAAHLMKYLVAKNEAVLIVNISREIDNHHHLLRKEEGFRTYFEKNKISSPVYKLDIRETDYMSVKKAMLIFLKQHQVNAIFVTNSRVSYVARFLQESKENKILLMGFDYTKENLEYLKNETIDFLICQKPREQGYKGIMALYQYLVHSYEVEKVNFMPIDIITKENSDSLQESGYLKS